MQPLVLCAYDVDVAPVFDALDGADKEALGIVDADLDCPAWRLEALSGRTPASHALADRLICSGFAGMRVRSYAAGSGAGDVNLVLWRWGDALPHRVALIDDERRLRASLRRVRREHRDGTGPPFVLYDSVFFPRSRRVRRPLATSLPSGCAGYHGRPLAEEGRST